MQCSVQVEKPSKITRKLTITIPAAQVDQVLATKFGEVQKTAKIKGFRPGMVPLSLIKQYYGSDVNYKTMSSIIDQSYGHALRENSIRPVSQPNIEPTGSHPHLHLHEGQDFSYSATVEIFPEIELKTYQGFSLKKDKPKVSDKDVEEVVQNYVDRHAEMIPLENEEGKETTRAIKKGDFAEFKFDGGLVTPEGIEKKEGMSGNHYLEIGSGQFIPGFEEEMIGLRRGESKTFDITFPKDYHADDFKGKKAQFSVDILEIKEKKLPEVTDEFAKDLTYENVADMKAKIREGLEKGKEDEAQNKLKNELLAELIKKNPFELPNSLVEAQMKHLLEDFVSNLKRQGVPEESIGGILEQQKGPMKEKAENQVRSGLLLEAVAEKEGISAGESDIDAHFKEMAENMKMEESKIREYYLSSPEQKENLEFRLKEEKTLKFILDQCKVK